MRATIADILYDAGAFADRIVTVDGILLITGFDRDASEFREVWLAQQDDQEKLALPAQPISSESTLWSGLSRLNPRHLPGNRGYRIHDAARARVRVEIIAGSPRINILSAAIYRQDFTLYVGVEGLWLDQCLPADAEITALPAIQANIARYLGRQLYVYGTLVIRSLPATQYLLPGKTPFAEIALRPLTVDAPVEDWLADIEYPQSDSQAPAEDVLPESIYIDPAYALQEQLARLPGITQTVVKPTIVAGSLAPRDHQLHFATLSEIKQVYLQNLTYRGDDKVLESVLRLKNFAPSAAAS
ncbi:MAG: hypothetical protein F4Y70_07620 [Chloroflexi bacterium]|nr:hypothetical protein [Chloroflexota bacterium]MXX83315.1 hypothetical protein [Chloroflexota bacterium]MYE78663.1 hypothetical protein [Chloroflexota bacterium]MYH64530.1 hypothetical protein [Chloroflexota bacterium]